MLQYLLFLFLFALLGFGREFVFVNINNQLFNLYYSRHDTPIPASLNWITGMSYADLYYFKYLLTLVCALLYFLCTFYAVKVLSGEKKFGRWVLYIYALLLILSGIAMAWGYVVNNRLGDEEYTFSRWAMGIAQSPLVAFFLVASASLYRSFQANKSN